MSQLQVGEGRDPGSRALYRVAWWVTRIFSAVFWRLSVEGTEKLPVEQPYVLAPVHRSNVDTPLMGMVARRRIRFMGKDSLWKAGRFWARFLTALGGFPVARGTADRASLLTCIAKVEAGEPVVLFPEGARQSGPVVQPLFDGAAYVATRCQVPVVPVGIGGSERAMPKGARFLRPGRIAIVVGEPLKPQPMTASGRVPRAAVRELTERLQVELQIAFDRARVRAGA